MLRSKITIAKPPLKRERRFVKFQALLLALVLALSLASRSQADSGNCGGQTITLPFTDVMGSSLFCQIAQLYFQGITLGTTATTYSPADNVRRDQMAAFLSRTQNLALQRGSQRATHHQFWTTTPQYTVTQGAGMLSATAVGSAPVTAASDGINVWVANLNSVARVRASDGKLLETWTGATDAYGVLAALGRVFVTSFTSPGNLYMLDPSQAPGAVTTLSSGLGAEPKSITFDGQTLWTANDGSVSLITPGATFTVSNVGGFGELVGILYDGANIWVTESGAPGQLKKLNASGAVVDAATVGHDPAFPIFDGTNIWVPNASSNSVSVVRPSDGEVLATLTGNGLNNPLSAAFDGQRILVTNQDGNSVSLFRAADFAPLGAFATGADTLPVGVCSDGLRFWITLSGQNALARF